MKTDRSTPNATTMLSADTTEIRQQEGTPFLRDMHVQEVGAAIRAARKQQHMTQAELGCKVGTDKSYISRIENGAIAPSAGLFFRLIAALGMQVCIERKAAQEG